MQPGQDRQSFSKLLELEQRSRAHGAAGPSETERAANWAGVVFRVGEHRLTCSIADITEILTMPGYTPVPGAKPWILGLANVRGNLVTVCDLLWALTGIRSPHSTRSRLLVAPMQGRPVGLLVDEVYGQRHFHTDDALESEQYKNTDLADLVQREYRKPDEAWGVLDVPALMQQGNFMNGAA